MPGLGKFCAEKNYKAPYFTGQQSFCLHIFNLKTPSPHFLGYKKTVRPHIWILEKKCARLSSPKIRSPYLSSSKKVLAFNFNNSEKKRKKRQWRIAIIDTGSSKKRPNLESAFDSTLKIAINLNNEMYLRVILEKELGSKYLIEYTVFFCWQLHFSVEAQVAYILGKNEAESCYVVA